MDALARSLRLIRTDPAVAAMAGLLTLTSGLILCMHPYAALRWGEAGPWDFAREDGMLSLLGWAMWLWGALLMTVLAAQLRAPSLLVWGVVLGYLGYDDATMLHERAGVLVHELTGAGFGETAELLVLVATGIAALVLVGGAYTVSGRRARAVHRALLALLAVGAFFGVAVDFAHSLVPRGIVFDVLTLVEQLGEHAVVVAIVVVAFSWVARAPDDEARAPEAGTGEATRRRPRLERASEPAAQP